MPREWQKRVADPAADHLNERVAERLEALENELRRHGVYVVCGAEQKFILFDKKRGSHRKSPSLLHIGDELIESGVRGLERVEEESRHAGKYQVVLGSVGENYQDFHPSVVIPGSALKVREALPTVLQDNYEVSFAPAHAHHRDATAGLHMNFSLFDADQNNLFYDNKHDAFSALAIRSAARLVDLQKEGQPVYLAGDAAYDRIGKHGNAPAQLGYSLVKGGSTVALRKTRKKHDGMSFHDNLEGDEGFPVSVHASYTAGGSQTGDFYRMEDRLAAANSNPYLVALADVGALYEAVVHPSASPAEPGMTPIKNDPRGAMKDFENSALWREVAGPELHREIVQYLKAQERGQSMQVGA